jgi:hypothetical protein
VILWALNHEEDWYKELSPEIRMSNWILPGGIRIPKPQEVGILVGSGIEAVLDTATGKDPKAMKAWADSLVSNLAPNFLPTLFLPLIEWMANYSFFTGRPVVSRKLQPLPDEKQYSNGTSEASKLVGSVTKTSPVKIDNFMRGYLGTMGMFIWQSGDWLIPEKRNMPAKKLNEMQFVRDFNVTDANLNRQVDEFYELLDAANKQHNASGRKGHPTRAVIRIKEAGTTIAGLRKDIQRVESNKVMSPERKREIIDRKKARIKRIAKRTVDRYGDKF